MSQRAVFGAHTGDPIGIAREHGSRVECIALAPWLLPMTLDHLGDYWGGHFAPSSTPESAVLSTFGVALS